MQVNLYKQERIDYPVGKKTEYYEEVTNFRELVKRYEKFGDSIAFKYKKDGEIKEIGTHDELLKNDNIYAKFYNHQAKKAKPSLLV